MTETATRKVLMSPVLMEEWATRDSFGNRLSWDWGEPDADGFYTPTITRHTDDNLVSAALGRLRERVAATPGLSPLWPSNPLPRADVLELIDDEASR